MNIHCRCNSGLGIVPIIFAMVSLITFLLTYIISVSNNHIYLYFPTISDIGGQKPQSNVFGLFLSLCSFMAIACIVMRYVQYRYIAEYNEVIRSRLILINKIALAIGCIVFFAITLIGSFQDWGRSINGHLVGAIAVLGSSVVYTWFQSYLSYRMIQCGIVSKKLCFVRLFLSTAATVQLAGFMILVYQLKGRNVEFHPNNPKLRPEDHGYILYVTGNACEWFCALSVILFVLSFSGEFNKIKIGFHVRRNDMNVLPFQISNEERTPLFYT